MPHSSDSLNKTKKVKHCLLFYLFSFPPYVDSLITVSPLNAISSVFLLLSVICSISNRQLSCAIFPIGCSTAVSCGWTKVARAVPDIQQSATSFGIRNPCFCISLLAPNTAVSVKPNTASKGTFCCKYCFITQLPSSADKAGDKTSWGWYSTWNFFSASRYPLNRS